MGNGPDGAPYTEYDESFDDVDPLIKGISNTMPDGGFLKAFRADVEAGRLPQVSWIVAPAAYSEHPGPSSPVQGGWYMAEVLDSLTAVPRRVRHDGADRRLRRERRLLRSRPSAGGTVVEPRRLGGRRRHVRRRG